MTEYDKWSLIISAIAAIATFSAVVVALWQTKYANRKKLKCDFFEKNTIVDPANYNKKIYVAMNITNPVTTNVILNNWGIKLKDSFIMIMTEGYEKDSFDKAVSVKLPYSLEPEENITFYYAENLFIELLRENIKKGDIDSDNKIVFVAHDSAGKSYIAKSKHKAKTYIRE